jgi:hypothetical protein
MQIFTWEAKTRSHLRRSKYERSQYLNFRLLKLTQEPPYSIPHYFFSLELYFDSDPRAFKFIEAQ